MAATGVLRLGSVLQTPRKVAVLLLLLLCVFRGVAQCPNGGTAPWVYWRSACYRPSPTQMAFHSCSQFCAPGALLCAEDAAGYSVNRQENDWVRRLRLLSCGRV